MTTTIAVQPLEAQETITGEAIQLDIFLQDGSGTYNRLEVWRSRSGKSGPYEELTAVDTAFPRIPDDAPDPPVTPLVGPSAILDTLTIELMVDDVDHVVTFAGADPISYGDAATQMNAQIPGLTAYVAPDGTFAIEGVTAGTLGRLEVTGGDAAPNLGLFIGTVVFGKSARVHTIPGQNRYFFTDLRGSRAYFYKTRLRNAFNSAVGEFSRDFSVASKFGVGPENMIVGQVDLVTLEGRALVNREVRLHSEFNGSMVDGKVMAGGDVVKSTDDNGHVEFRLVRGQQLTVAVPGSTLYRQITVPSDPAVEVFNLLDPDISGEDIFKVRVPELIVAERRTL